MKKLLYALLSISLLLTGCSSSKQETPETDESQQISFTDDYSQFKVTHTGSIVIEDYGTLEFELYGELAPETVGRFVECAKDGAYNQSTFHRIVQHFMMQGGITTNNKQYNTITGEFLANQVLNLLSHSEGVMSFCRTSQGYDTGSEQFFICCDDVPSLDGYYAAFGRITKGLDLVKKICADLGTEDQGGAVNEDEQPIIESVTVKVV